jgi:hypothetical protein
MKNIKILRKIYWALFALVFLIFWYSLRYAEEQYVEFTLLALLVWGVTFWLNRYIKKLENLDEE